MISRGKKHAKNVRMLAGMHGFKYEGKDLDGVLHYGKDCYPFAHYDHNDKRTKTSQTYLKFPSTLNQR